MTVEINATSIGVFIGILGIAGGVIRYVMRAADNRMVEKIKLFLGNGGGDMIANKVELGIIRALNNHQNTCPLSARVDDLAATVHSLQVTP